MSPLFGSNKKEKEEDEYPIVPDEPDFWRD